MAVVAAVPTWYFWPLIYDPGPEPLPDDWTPVVGLVAGTGDEGREDGDLFRATFSDPFAVAVGPDGAVYVADGGSDNAIRRIAPSGLVTTLAGGIEGFADGRGEAAQFNTPSGVAVDGGVVYVADTGNHAIRRIGTDQTVTTLASGSGVRFNSPIGIALDGRGGLLVADTYNDRIRIVSAAGDVTTLAGDGTPGMLDGPAPTSRFDTPTGLALAPDGAVIVADTGNDVLRRISPDGWVTTLPSVDRSGLPEALMRPTGVAVAPDGRVFVTDRTRVLELNPAGVTRVLAGGASGYAEGSGAVARFRNPTGVALSIAGEMVVADAGNRLIRRLARTPRDASPPAPPGLRPGFDLARFAELPLLWPLEPQGGPHEIAGTLGEARGNPGGKGRERFHAGVDVHGEDGDLVLAVRDGKVDQPIATGNFGGLNEFVAIGPLTYVHTRVARDRSNRALDPDRVAVLVDPTGAPFRARVRRGWRLHTGEAVGTVNRFRHVHLTVGPAGEEANALDLRLPNFVDTIPPTIAPHGVVLTDIAGTPITERRHGRLIVRGAVRIVVEAWDRMDGDALSRRLGVYRLGYQVLEADLRPAPGFETPRVTISFDRLPSDPEAPLALYAPGSGIPFYGVRRTHFRYVVTTRVEDGHVTETPWDPSGLAPGDYVLRVLVADAAGNLALSGRDVPITLP